MELLGLFSIVIETCKKNPNKVWRGIAHGKHGKVCAISRSFGYDCII